MPRPGTSTVQVADIAIQGRLRPVNAAAVVDLAQSIDAIGLQTPITVRRDRDEVILVAGRHRLEAARSLGWVDIPARFLEGDADAARLWEIAENLHRAELTRLERDEHVAEWIRLNEAKRSDKLSPAETVSQKGGRGNEGGIRAAARELGINKDAAHRAIKHADIATEAKDALIAAGLDNSRAALDAVAAAPKGEQVAKVAEIVHRRDQPPDQGEAEAEASADSAGLEPAPPQAEPPPLVVTPIGVVTAPEPADPLIEGRRLVEEARRILKPLGWRIWAVSPPIAPTEHSALATQSQVKNAIENSGLTNRAFMEAAGVKYNTCNGWTYGKKKSIPLEQHKALTAFIAGMEGGFE